MSAPRPLADLTMRPVTVEREWAALLTKLDRLPLEQSWAFGQSMAAFGRLPHRFCFEQNGKALAVAQVVEQRLGPVRLCHLLRGPLLLSGTAPDLLPPAVRLLRQHFRRRDRRLLLVTPELPAGDDTNALCRQAGIARIITGYATSWVDLTRPDLEAGMGGGFRKALKKARGEKLTLAASHGGSDLDWIIRHHDDHRRQRRLMAPPAQQAASLVAAQSRPRDVLALVAKRGSSILAGSLFIRHGGAATYYLGATSPQGRTACAQHLLLREGMARLAADGVRWLDTGGLNSDGMRGVAQFKLGLGGELVTLAGTYL